MFWHLFPAIEAATGIEAKSDIIEGLHALVTDLGKVHLSSLFSGLPHEALVLGWPDLFTIFYVPLLKISLYLFFF